MRRQKIFLVLLLVLFLSERSFAQSVRWDPPGGQLGFNQVSQLDLVFENCEPGEGAKLPAVPGLTFGDPSVSSSTNAQFGSGSANSITRTYTLTFPVRPERRSAITIPAFDLKTDKGAIRVAAATFTVGDAPTAGAAAVAEQIASAKLVVPRESFWAGEVFPVTYNLNVARQRYHSLGSAMEWPSTPLVTEEWTKPELRETLLRGEHRVLLTQTTRAYAKTPGTLSVRPATQIVNVNVGTTGFSFFSQVAAEPRQLQTNPLQLTIKPLPPAPPDFSGAVGEFAFTSKVIPTTAGVGEPVTWTIEVSGTGNWPDIAGLPQREVSNDFQVVQPKSKRTMKEGSVFEGTLSEDVVLVPSRPGTYRLAPVSFTYFDTKSGTYKTIASAPVAVTVTAGAQPAQPAAGPGAPVQFSLNPSAGTAPAAPVLPNAVPPVPPENLPRSPLTESASGFAPLHVRKLVLTCLLCSVLCVLSVWLTLAALRSRARDPQRRRREARRMLVKTLAELRSSGSQLLASPKPGEGGSHLPSTISHLRIWQSETAKLWEIPHAAPPASAFAYIENGVAATSPRSLQNRGEVAPAPVSEWARLWSEADRSLHSREQNLPADWITRAEAALQATKIPGWNPFSLFAGRHLFPFLGTNEALKTEGLNGAIRAAAWLVLLFSLSALQPSAFGAPPPVEAYNRGDFAAAETDWRTAITTAPHDWTARHNLGLALAQQDRWAEATAHWTSAFLLNARADTTRFDLALGLQRSGMAPAELVELSRGESFFQLVRLATPGEWQLGLIVAALLLAAALIALLLQGYRRIGPWAKPVALTTSLLAMLLAAAATFSLHAYGPLAHPDAALVWKASTLRSIPTEADTTQKTSPLSAGSIAVTEKTFLGWTKLNFPAGQSGWVRTEDLIRLYR